MTHMSIRLSPLHECIVPLTPRWGEVQGMRTPMEIPGERGNLPVQLSDASCLVRMGVKGVNAQSWLRRQHVDTPSDINSWVRNANGVMVARLARGEFFLENDTGGDSLRALQGFLSPAFGLSPVLSQDAALVLYGEKVNELLVQICNVDFRAWQARERVVVMTSMVGVSVLVLWEPHLGHARYRLWCDHTFGPYLWDTLLEIARELGGGAVGLKMLMPDITG